MRPLSPALNAAVEINARILYAAFSAWFFTRLWREYSVTPQWSLVLLAASEAVTVSLVITARLARSADRRLPISIATAIACFYFASLDVTARPALLPVAAVLALQGAGLALQVASKLWLGRSFGLLPANRGIVTSGPYRLVRHPMYLGYFVADAGFLLSSFSLHNLAVYAFYTALQVFRISAEERLLLEDAAYQEYAARVPWRAIPGFF